MAGLLDSPYQGLLGGAVNLARGLLNPAGFGMAMAPAAQRMGGQAVGTLMQANQAMPWGGNDPRAIGIDPQMGTIDPSVMVPFATDVAGMATTGSFAGPSMTNATGMGLRTKFGDDGLGGRILHGSRTGQIHPDATEIYTSPDPDVASSYAGQSGKVFEAMPVDTPRVIDLDNPSEDLIAAIIHDEGTGRLPDWLDEAAANGPDEIRRALYIEDLVDHGGPLEDTDFVNWLYERFEPDAVQGGGGGVILNKDAYTWGEIDPYD